jgi:hypothetical protein
MGDYDRTVSEKALTAGRALRFGLVGSDLSVRAERVAHVSVGELQVEPLDTQSRMQPYLPRR